MSFHLLNHELWPLNWGKWGWHFVLCSSWFSFSPGWVVKALERYFRRMATPGHTDINQPSPFWFPVRFGISPSLSLLKINLKVLTVLCMTGSSHIRIFSRQDVQCAGRKANWAVLLPLAQLVSQFRVSLQRPLYLLGASCHSFSGSGTDREIFFFLCDN